MIVPVPVVGGVPVPFVQVVGVTLVRHRHMPALLPVLVGMALMRRVLTCLAFVHVVIVDAVNVPVMLVIGVIAVRERDVAAALAVDVLVAGVRGVLDGIRHSGSPSRVVVSNV